MKISDAELEIIQVIWKEKQTTSLEIISQLSYKNWTNQTIRTLIKRLIAKNAIRIVEKRGKKYIYEAVLNEEEFKREVFKDFVDRVFKGDSEKFFRILSETIDDNKKAV